MTVDRNGLYVTDKILLNHRDLEASVFFSDGESLGMITSAKDVSRLSSPLNTLQHTTWMVWSEVWLIWFLSTGWVCGQNA